jgi:hypothetical protein
MINLQLPASLAFLVSSLTFSDSNPKFRKVSRNINPLPLTPLNAHTDPCDTANTASTLPDTTNCHSSLSSSSLDTSAWVEYILHHDQVERIPFPGAEEGLICLTLMVTREPCRLTQAAKRIKRSAKLPDYVRRERVRRSQTRPPNKVTRTDSRIERMPTTGPEEKQRADMSLENLFDDDDIEAEMMLVDDATDVKPELEPVYELFIY